MNSWVVIRRRRMTGFVAVFASGGRAVGLSIVVGRGGSCERTGKKSCIRRRKVSLVVLRIA